MNTQEMQEMLFKLLANSKLDKLFKLGHVKVQDKKLPNSVSVRLKLHNPYTFLEFQLVAKKTGLKFIIQHLVTIPSELKKYLFSLDGVSDNSNKLMEFDCDGEEGELSQKLTAIYEALISAKFVSICQAEDYKPLKIIKAEAENN